MRKLILLLMIVVFVTTIITVDSARPAKGKACRNAGGRCYRDKKAERFCKEYDDEANDCGESKECCLVTASQRKGTVAKRTSKCAGDCDVGTCTPEQRCPEGMRRGRCGRKCVCCTKVKISKSNGNDSEEKGDSSEEKKPKKPGKIARTKESRPRKGMQKCVTTDECSMKGGKCKKKCKKNGDSSLCSGDCTCCGICQPKGKCSRFDGVCKSSCDGTERLITGGCKKKKKCSCCAPKCTQNGCQGECVSRKKDCNGNFIKNGCGGFKCHCCTSGGTDDGSGDDNDNGNDDGSGDNDNGNDNDNDNGNDNDNDNDNGNDNDNDNDNGNDNDNDNDNGNDNDNDYDNGNDNDNDNDNGNDNDNDNDNGNDDGSGGNDNDNDNNNDNDNDNDNDNNNDNDNDNDNYNDYDNDNDGDNDNDNGNDNDNDNNA